MKEAGHKIASSGSFSEAETEERGELEEETLKW